MKRRAMLLGESPRRRNMRALATNGRKSKCCSLTPKRILRLDRLRLRGMTGANDEFTMAAAVQNLRRLAKLTSQGPPTTG